jgi:glycine dehydrogenase subunit 1
MALPYIPHTKEDQREMLKEIGVKSIEELLKLLPQKIRLTHSLNIPPGMSEIELAPLVKKLSQENAAADEYRCFLGGGAYDHFVPSVVDHLASRSEFYTSYTPYQPEASQGILQVFYEYQSLICNLFQMEVSNASLYDGATALAEATVMAHAITQRKKVLVARTVHPEFRQVMLTYTKAMGMHLIDIDYKDGTVDLQKLEDNIDDKTSCVVIQSPNFLGYMEDVQELERITHRFGSLYVVCVDPISLGLITPPGEYNADIAVAEGQALGNPIYFGGGCLGVFTSKKEFLRKIPGRLIGETSDKQGRRGFVLTLQTREQHIRREKATSNICTNQALNALRAAIYLSCLSEEGLREVAGLCLENSHYLMERITKIPGFSSPFNSSFFKEFVVRCPCPAKMINKILLQNKIIGGLDLGRFYPELRHHLLFCTTEKRTKKEIDELIVILEEVK